MSSFPQIQQAMRDVGRLADLLVVDEYEDERLWHIAIDETTELFVELADARDALVLSIPVGTPANPPAVYELALRYAGLWSETDGSRLALDAPGGGFTLICEIGARDLSAQALAALILAAGERARAWKKIINDERDPAEDALSVAAHDNFIKI